MADLKYWIKTNFSLEELRKAYYDLLVETSETEEEVRKMAKKVLPDLEVYGDSYGVPGIGDIVESLIKRIDETNTK